MLMFDWVLGTISSIVIFWWFIKKDYMYWCLRLPAPKPKNKTLELIGILIWDLYISIVCGFLIVEVVSIFNEVLSHILHY